MIDVAADDVLRAIVKAVKDTDGVDADAIARMLPVDDWGWKGGKPGEITGGMYVRELNEAFKRLAKGNPNNPRWLAAEAAIYNKYDPKILDQIAKSSNIGLKKAFSGDIDEFMEGMKALEEADIPREWTGKVYPALRSTLTRWERITPAKARAVSDAMRGMYIPDNPELTKQYRETFLSLLPDWSGSLEDLAEAARNL